MITQDYEFIIEHSESRFCFVENDALFQKINSLKGKISTLQEVFLLQESFKKECWINQTEENEDTNSSVLSDIKKTINEDDLVSIIYTSGTGGKPKGVMLTHKNIMHSVKGGALRIPGKAGDRVISFLPISHVYERMMIYLYMYVGYSVFYAENLYKIAENIQEVKPHAFAAVPRFLEKIYEKFISKGQQLKGIKKKIFLWSINIAQQYDIDKSKKEFFYVIKLYIARRLVLSKLKAALGGELITISSASARLSEKIAKLFYASGVPILEGYGLTETSPTISVSHFDGGTKSGTTGPVLNGLEIKISEEKEILVKGNSVMKGYYKLPDLTKEVFTSDGWFKTGDLGEIVDDKFLKILGRKNNTFKLSNGEFVNPQKIEELLTDSDFVEYALVTTQNDKYVTAYIFLANNYVSNWLEENYNIKENSLSLLEEMIQNKHLIEKIESIIKQTNTKLNTWEKIKDIKILPIEPSVENGLVTPTFKLKKNEVISWVNKKILPSL